MGDIWRGPLLAGSMADMECKGATSLNLPIHGEEEQRCSQTIVHYFISLFLLFYKRPDGPPKQSLVTEGKSLSSLYFYHFCGAFGSFGTPSFLIF